jgi:hypothetical protein
MVEPIFKYQTLINKIIALDETYISYLSSNTNLGAVEFLENTPDHIDWYSFSFNSNTKACRILEKNVDQIVWELLSQNTNPVALKILEKNFDNISWPFLNYNNTDDAIDLLNKNPKNINWYGISRNSGKKALELITHSINSKSIDNMCLYNLSSNTFNDIIKILKKMPDLINWDELSFNPSDEAINILQDNPDKINFFMLCLNNNPRIISILNENLDKINWDNLSKNSNPSTIKLLEKYPKNINYSQLCSNRYGVNLLKEYAKNNNFDPISIAILCENTAAMDLINEKYDSFMALTQDDYETNRTIIRNILKNPALFDLDYKEMSKKRTKIIYYDLIEQALHPRKVSLWLNDHLDNLKKKIEDFEMT